MNAGDKDQRRLCRSSLCSDFLQSRRSSLVYCSSTAQYLLQERVISRRVPPGELAHRLPTKRFSVGLGQLIGKRNFGFQGGILKY